MNQLSSPVGEAVALLDTILMPLGVLGRAARVIHSIQKDRAVVRVDAVHQGLTGQCRTVVKTI